MVLKNHEVKLNKDIEIHFVNEIKKISPSFHMHFEGISRLIMLDRYAQKDEELITLGIGDLVLTVVKNDPFFPTKGIGFVEKIDDDIVTIKLEKDYLHAIDPNDENEEGILKRHKRDVIKPLEIYFEQIAARVAKTLSKVEKSENQKKYEEEFFDEVSNLRIVPAGRILYGSGSRSNVTLFNCFVLPHIHDSREGLANHRAKAMEIMSRGGGIGTNGSTLRPRNAIAKQVGGRSSGAVSWLNDLARLTHLIQQGGSRRGAQMIMLADWHPDTIEFIISKMQNPEIIQYLAKNSSEKLIRTLARNRMKFVPLSNHDKVAYEVLLDDADKQSLLSDQEIRELEKKLSEGGNWVIDDTDQLNGANISIAISDRFMAAIKNDEVWEFKFPDLESYNEEDKEYYDKHWQQCGDVFDWEEKHHKKVKTYTTIKAKALWDLINFCATYSAEPGIFFLDRANYYTNASAYGKKVIATNPCGEQPLPAYAVCNLGAINLSQFANRSTKDINWEELEKTIRIAVRLQDNVNDVTPYFLSENKEMATNERRVGLGIMGLHDLLIWCGYVYGSTSSIQFIDNLFKFIAETAYDESANLALEKGSFPFLNGNKKEFVNTGFCKQLSQKLRAKILNQGIRNSHLLTIAPTGTTGTMVGVATGLEPYYSFSYYRSGRLGENIRIDANIVEEYRKFHNLKATDKLPEVFISTNELTPEQHVNVQVTIQKWIDSSISKTVNAPKGYSVKNVEKIYEMLYEKNAKGGTVYVDGSRNSQVLNLEKTTDNKKQVVLEEVVKNKRNAKDNKKIKPIEKSLRANRLDKAVGTKVGDICPLCHEGIIIISNGCHTCTNCQAQLSCEIS